MVAVKLSVYVGEDRNLQVKLPEDAPTGMLQLVLTSIEMPADDDALRAQLIAADVLVNPADMDIPDDLDYFTDEELEQLDSLPPGTPTALDLINEDRGAY